MSTVQEQKAIQEKNNLRRKKMVNKDAISKTSALIDCIIWKKKKEEESNNLKVLSCTYLGDKLNSETFQRTNGPPEVCHGRLSLRFLRNWLANEPLDAKKLWKCIKQLRMRQRGTDE